MISVLGGGKYATVLLGVVLACFFVSVQWLNVGVREVVSPDEASNLMFSERVAKGDGLAIEVAEEIAEAGDQGVFPRSTISLDGRVVPTSFLGMPLLYGAVGRVFGVWVIPFLTGALAVLGVVLWADVVAYMFGDRRVGVLAGLFLMTMPAYWFYAGRAMMHNVPFLVFGIIAVWFGVVAKDRGWRYAELWSGVAVGLALAFRLGEVIWVSGVIALLIGFALWTKAWSKQSLIFFILGGVLVAVPLSLAQQSVYGSPFETGYTIQPTYSVTPEEPPRPPTEVTQADYPGLLGVLFPFGFHERAIARNAWNYLIVVAPHVALLALAGVVIALLELRRKRRWSLILFGTIALGVTAWLGVVYGSWVFYDNANRDLVTLGNSYARYWLPIYALWTPLMAYGVAKFWAYMEHRWKAGLAFVFVALLIMVTVTLNARLVFFGEDGFLNARRVLMLAHEQSEKVMRLTEQHAVIIVDTEDKYLYPERQVLVPLRTERTYALIPRIAKVAPLYYYGITLPETDLNFLNEVRLAPVGLFAEPVALFNDKTLYRFAPLENAP